MIRICLFLVPETEAILSCLVNDQPAAVAMLSFRLEPASEKKKRMPTMHTTSSRDIPTTAPSRTFEWRSYLQRKPAREDTMHLRQHPTQFEWYYLLKTGCV